MTKHEADPNAVLTTQHAARMLGLSVSSVQQMVEQGTLEGWKTQGGHRRITLAAVQAYLDRYAGRGERLPPQRLPSLLVVEDNAMQLALYRKMLQQWSLPLLVRYCDSGYKALLSIARDPPDILLTDIVMDGIDGLALVRAVMEDQLLGDMQIAVMTALSAQELSRHGHLPPSVAVMHKPVNGDELRGYLKGASATALQQITKLARRAALP